MAKISVTELANQQGHTLAWGYDFQRNSHHVYVQDGQIHSVKYDYPNLLISHEVGTEIDCELLSPVKRAYPDACDEQFCQLMKEKGVELSFTVPNEHRKVQPYRGLRFEELVEVQK